MKKNNFYFLFLFLIFSSFILYSESKEDYFILSSWIPETYFKHIDSNLKMPCIKNQYYTYIPNISLLITLKNKTNNFGTFEISGYNPVLISSHRFIEENYLELLCNYLISEQVKTGGYENRLSDSLFSIFVKIIDEDEIIIDKMSVGYDLFGITQGTTWYRISGPAKIPPQNAIINDSRIRLRTKPTLESDTWGFLNTGDRVIIKDKTDEKFTIDGESWYWYKVEFEGYPDGWVYGKYVDVE